MYVRHMGHSLDVDCVCVSYEEEDTCMSYEEEDTCMSDTWDTLSTLTARVCRMRRRIHACQMRRRIHVCPTHGTLSRR